MADLVKLNAELAKPEYANLDDVAAAQLVNKQDKQVNLETIDAGSLVVAIFPDYIALSTEQKEKLTFLLRAQQIPIKNGVRDFLNDLFPAGDARQRLRAALKRVGSRAEESGIGRVTESDVADARRLT